MERLALNDLICWNKSANRKPLIVWGARKTGKSYLIKELFAKTFYKNKFIYIDFKIEDEIREFCFQTAKRNSQKRIKQPISFSCRKNRSINFVSYVIR